MSKQIAEIRHPKTGKVLVYVSASLGGVEVTADEETSFSPTTARAYANALLAAAEETERMRDHVRSQTPEEAGYPGHTLADMAAHWEP